MIIETIAWLGLVLIPVGLTLIAIRSSRMVKRQRLVGTLLSAATSGDTVLLQQTLNQGITINQTTAQGDTALHYDYYTGDQKAIDNLRAYGADENLRNNEGLTPQEMTEVAATETLLRQGVERLNSNGTWQDSVEGYRIYSRLKVVPRRIYNPAVVRQVLQHDRRRELLILAIKIGKYGSQEKLVEVLDGFGDKTMAEDYMNAGSPSLRGAAERWARRHNYQIFSTSGRAKVAWGRF